MKEKDFQTLFSAWVEINKIKIKTEFGLNCSFELKISKTKSIRFDVLKPHQRIALIECEDEGCYHKINDMPFIPGNSKMRFTNKKPFDCFFMSNANAYIVVWFYKKGQRKKDRVMIFIRAMDWFIEENIAIKENRKSVREEYLETIGVVENFCLV